MKVLSYLQLVNQSTNLSVEQLSQQIDAVALGVFEPLDQVHLSFSLKDEKVKPHSALLQNIPLQIIEANRFSLSAQGLPVDDSLNSHYPGDFGYGGAFLLEDLVNGKRLNLKIAGYPNDVFDQVDINHAVTLGNFVAPELQINLIDLAEPIAYVNSGPHLKFTDHGVVKNNWATINFRTSGLLQLIYELCQAQIGFDHWFVGGTQDVKVVTDKSFLRLITPFDKMDTLYISGLSLKGFGVYLAVGIGVTIPVKNRPEIIQKIIDNETRQITVIDINQKKKVGVFSVKELRQPQVSLKGHDIKTASLSSLYLSERISERLSGN